MKRDERREWIEVLSVLLRPPGPHIDYLPHSPKSPWHPQDGAASRSSREPEGGRPWPRGLCRAPGAALAVRQASQIWGRSLAYCKRDEINDLWISFLFLELALCQYLANITFVLIALPEKGNTQ